MTARHAAANWIWGPKKEQRRQAIRGRGPLIDSWSYDHLGVWRGFCINGLSSTESNQRRTLDMIYCSFSVKLQVSCHSIFICSNAALRLTEHFLYGSHSMQACLLNAVCPGRQILGEARQRE